MSRGTVLTGWLPEVSGLSNAAAAPRTDYTMAAREETAELGTRDKPSIFLILLYLRKKVFTLCIFFFWNIPSERGAVLCLKKRQVAEGREMAPILGQLPACCAGKALATSSIV